MNAICGDFVLGGSEPPKSLMSPMSIRKKPVWGRSPRQLKCAQYRTYMCAPSRHIEDPIVQSHLPRGGEAFGLVYLRLIWRISQSFSGALFFGDDVNDNEARVPRMRPLAMPMPICVIPGASAVVSFLKPSVSRLTVVVPPAPNWPRASRFFATLLST